MQTKSLLKGLPVSLKRKVGLIPFKKIASGVFKFNKGSQGAVIIDEKGTPKLFVFDTFAFLDILSIIDESLVDRLTTKEYHDKSINPSGFLIDKLESRIPLNSNFISSLRKSLAEAKRKGWISLEEIEETLGLR